MLHAAIADEVSALIKVAEGDLNEAQAVESGLSKVQTQAQKAGLDLNLREIEYSRLNRQRQSSSKLYDLLLQRISETDLTRLLRTTHVRVVDRALVPESAISPMVQLNIFGGVFAGLLLGFGLAFLLHQLDRRIRDVSDVERLGLTILGIFPRIGEGSAARAPTIGARRAQTEAMDLENASQVVHTHPMSRCGRVVPDGAHEPDVHGSAIAFEHLRRHERRSKGRQDNGGVQSGDRARTKRSARALDRRRPAAPPYSRCFRARQPNRSDERAARGHEARRRHARRRHRRAFGDSERPRSPPIQPSYCTPNNSHVCSPRRHHSTTASSSIVRRCGRD